MPSLVYPFGTRELFRFIRRSAAILISPTVAGLPALVVSDYRKAVMESRFGLPGIRRTPWGHIQHQRITVGGAEAEWRFHYNEFNSEALTFVLSEIHHHMGYIP